jgi:hypothetical protein
MGRRKTRDNPGDLLANEPQTHPDFSGAAVEKRLIGKAYAEAERRLDDGTASSEMICLFLKMGSSKQYLDDQKAILDLEYTKAKTEMIRAQKRNEEQFAEAMAAMRSYQGLDDELEEL